MKRWWRRRRPAPEVIVVPLHRLSPGELAELQAVAVRVGDLLACSPMVRAAFLGMALAAGWALDERAKVALPDLLAEVEKLTAGEDGR